MFLSVFLESISDKMFNLLLGKTSRGYTGHEHMDETYLINMNGRVYDPLVGLFLCPRPILQEPIVLAP